MIESLLLSLTAGVVGAFVTWISLRPLVALTHGMVPADSTRSVSMLGGFCSVSAFVCHREPLLWLDPALQVLSAQSRSGVARIGSARERRSIAVTPIARAGWSCRSAWPSCCLLAPAWSSPRSCAAALSTWAWTLGVAEPPGAVAAAPKYMKEKRRGGAQGSRWWTTSGGPLLIDRIQEALQGVPGVVHAAGVTNPH